MHSRTLTRNTATLLQERVDREVLLRCDPGKFVASSYLRHVVSGLEQGQGSVLSGPVMTARFHVDMGTRMGDGMTYVFLDAVGKFVRCFKREERI